MYVSIILSSAVIASIVSSILTFVFDRWRDNTSRKLRIKGEAYGTVIATISGMADDMVGFMLRNNKGGKIDSIAVLEYIRKIEKKISPAMLVANKDLSILLKKIVPLAKECQNIIEKTFQTTKPVVGGYTISRDTPAAKMFKLWGETVDNLEEEIISAMQKDIGIY